MAKKKTKKKSPGPIVITTWHFSGSGTKVSGQLLDDGAPRLFALEEGLSTIEANPHVSCIGPWSIPNAQGVLELDAAMMDGPRHESGAVMALQGVDHPIQVARRVLEEIPHAQLVGQGAQDFARKQGFKIHKRLPIAEKGSTWLANKFSRGRLLQHHIDTATQLLIDRDGALAAGSSTSGWPGSLPGRVGDSPVVGAGLYVDQNVGAAGASGEGEEILKFCLSFDVVSRMKQGLSPQKACEAVIADYVKVRGKSFRTSIALLALDTRGKIGALLYGGVKRSTFPYFVWSQGKRQKFYAKKIRY